MNHDDDKPTRSSKSNANNNNNNNYEEDDVSNSTSDLPSDDDSAWIPWFCSLKGNEFFCEVDENYARDSFNLTGLNSQVPYYDYALDIILDNEANDELLSDDQQEVVENDAEHLYGLIHARYILTSRGLHAVLEKYRHFHYGRCPRVLCGGQAVLPVGLSDTPNEDSVKLYCPKCEDVYHPKASRHEHTDGAYFGTTFPHLFFLTYPELKPEKSIERYIPRVFGFRVHKDAYKKSLDARKKQLQQAQQQAQQQQQQQTQSTQSNQQIQQSSSSSQLQVAQQNLPPAQSSSSKKQSK